MSQPSSAQQLCAILAVVGDRQKRLETEQQAETAGGQVRDAGSPDDGTSLLLFHSVEDAAGFAQQTLRRGGVAMGFLIGEVYAGPGRNTYLEAATALAQQARAGEMLLTETVSDLLRNLDLTDIEMQALGPRELPGFKRTTGIFRSGQVETDPDAAAKSAQTSQVDVLLMQAREEAKRERENNRRNLGILIGCFGVAFVLFSLALFGYVLWQSQKAPDPVIPLRSLPAQQEEYLAAMPFEQSCSY